jgi:pimeloyl-ACP methyl ester carboxylesterase
MRRHLAFGPLAVLLGLTLMLAGCRDRSQVGSAGSAPESAPASGSVTIPAFYGQPVPPGRPGDIIHAEQLPAAHGLRAWRILYHSTTPSGADIAVSGLVVTPTSPPPTEGRTIVAWGHGTTGSGDSCAPSVQDDPVSTIEDGTALLQHGYAIAATDYPGLGTPGPHPYLVGESEARAVLDSARAATHISQLHASHRVIGWGHSQGGQAVLWAAQIAPQYAPDLHMVGTVAAAPAADVPALLRNLISNTHYGTGYLVLAAAGYAALHPALNVATLMTASGKSHLPSIEAPCNSTNDIFTQYNSLSIDQAFTDNPLTTKPWSDGLASDSVGAAPITTPILIVQGDKDTSVPRRLTDALIERMRAARDVVDYHTYPLANHDQVPAIAEKDILDWIARRLQS